MDFANERYVRLYLRETTNYRLMPWEGQALLAQVLKLMDRSGVFELGGATPAEAVSMALPKWPTEVIEKGVAAMLERGIVEQVNGAIVWPRFVEAQETPASSAERNRLWRETKRLARKTKGVGRETRWTLSEPEEPDFIEAWGVYPQRSGTNSRAEALSAWSARRKEGVPSALLLDGVKRYGAFCRAEGKIGTQYVMAAASFFGPKKRGWEGNWTVARSPAAGRDANGQVRLVY